eukprot:m.177698 g.177698  ORF g.177698 m.177698 type:complete len:218 (-) comp14633_c0_seq22:556-1209(-)
MHVVGDLHLPLSSPLLALLLLSFLSETIGIAGVTLALLVYLDPLFLMLVVPLLSASDTSNSTRWSLVAWIIVGLLGIFGVQLMYWPTPSVFAEMYTERWLNPALEPSISPYWYFFTLVFSHYRQFFGVVFWLLSLMMCSMTSYVSRASPLLQFTMIVLVKTLTGSTMHLPDLALPLSLLGLFPFLFPCMFVAECCESKRRMCKQGRYTKECSANRLV